VTGIGAITTGIRITTEIIIKRKMTPRPTVVEKCRTDRHVDP
jgi:hypothetical protein